MNKPWFDAMLDEARLIGQELRDKNQNLPWFDPADPSSLVPPPPYRGIDFSVMERRQ